MAPAVTTPTITSQNTKYSKRNAVVYNLVQAIMRPFPCARYL